MLTFDSTKESSFLGSNLDIAFFRFSSNRKTFNHSLVMYNDMYNEYPVYSVYSWDYYDCIKQYEQFYVLPYENTNVNL
jgi:hypothetical protein